VSSAVISPAGRQQLTSGVFFVIIIIKQIFDLKRRFLYFLIINKIITYAQILFAKNHEAGRLAEIDYHRYLVYFLLGLGLVPIFPAA